ncbi:MAG TPA: hypothetical protein VG603_10685 [Chitinophagales bacterium]|nr:hypothetical protein [Chitinophagales bacterium]
MAATDPFIDKLHQRLQNLTGCYIHKGWLALFFYGGAIIAAGLLLSLCYKPL